MDINIQKVSNKIKPYNLEVLKAILNDKAAVGTDTKPSPDPNRTKNDWRLESYLDHKRDVMIISSFGDQTFPGTVVVDKPQDNSTSDKSRLELARQELDTLQDLYWKSDTNSLAYVYPDFPGAQFSREYYMDRMKQFMLKCREGAVLYYSGHGEKDTGNWCFKDGVITFDDVFGLYMDTMRGKPLYIVSDCCFAGKWVENAAVKLDELGIPSCGHHTREQEILLKVFASCRKNQKAAMSSYTKKQASINEKHDDDKRVYYPGGSIDSDQDVVNGDFIEICCNKKHTEQCQVIQPKSRWVDRVCNGFFIYTVRGKDRGKPAWHYVLVDEEKESAFKEKVATGNIDVADYGEVIKSGWGKDPPQSVKDMINRRFASYLPQVD